MSPQITTRVLSCCGSLIPSEGEWLEDLFLADDAETGL